MKVRVASDITTDSIVDGPGLRAVVWTQGCNHNCPGCHNPETHDFNRGLEMDTEEIISNIKNLRLHRGITLSGGDPLEQAQACYEIARAAKGFGMDIWMYTGYTFEYILKNLDKKSYWAELMDSIDILVDGPFIQSQKSLMLPFRGSMNQRIIDVKESLKRKEIVVLQQYHQKVV